METKTEIHNPQYVGPGVWYLSHTLAMAADIDKDYDFFIKFFKKMVNSFGCEKCKQHAQAYITKNPLSQIGDDYLPSLYVNKFHNTVNIRLGKETYSIDKSRAIFESVCKDCMLESEPQVSII